MSDEHQRKVDQMLSQRHERNSRSRSPVKRSRSRSPVGNYSSHYSHYSERESRISREREQSPRERREPPRERREERRERRHYERDRDPRRDNPQPFTKYANESERYGKPTLQDPIRAEPPEKPNYNLSGALAADVNTYKGVVLKYSEPLEARTPENKLRLYVFKGDEALDVLHIHRQSAYLIGRERLVADIPVDHPSCSKQHAALQYRQIVKKNELGQIDSKVKLYIIDLESANGTLVNNELIPPSRYYELMVNDVIKFGHSSREYVLMAEDPNE